MIQQPIDRRTMRVCWISDVLPRPGDALVSSAGRQTYRIRRVKVLHHAPLSDKPRLQLTVTRHGKDAGTSTVTGQVLPWAMTTPPPRILPPSTPKPVPPVSSSPSVDERSITARTARIASEDATPPKSEASVWDDPFGTANTKVPKQIKGRRRGDVLGRYSRRGTNVTRDHVEAAHRFRLDWDVAHIGLSGMNPLADKVGGTKPGPVLGPTKLATRRAAAEREVQRVLRRFGPAASARLLWVIVENKEISAWCCMFSEHHGVKKPDPKLEFGRLLAGLDQLAEHYGVNEARDKAKEARAAMERP